MSSSFVVALLLAGGLQTFAADDKPRLNVLILLADDLRADAIGALGCQVARTPNLDGLVRRGFVFRNAYCQGANIGAVCTPSRNMILSGRSYFRFGRLAEADRPNLPASMNAAGYATFHCGKRGNTATAIQALFQVNRYLPDDEKARRSGHPGKLVADAAIEFLKTRDRCKPFCMYLGFEAPHDPRVAAPHDLRQFDVAAMPLPVNFMTEHPFDNGELEVRDEKLAAKPRVAKEIREHLRDYHAVIAGLDRQIGRVLATIEAAGDMPNTLIVFSSDHGLAIGSHGLMGKQSLYEHSMKSPLIFAGPPSCVPAGGQSDAFAYLFDIYPTICELVGVARPDNIDGASLAPVTSARQATVRDTVFLAYRDVQRAIRRGRWKLLYYPKIQKTQLFDVVDDPDEVADIAALPEHAARVAELRGELVQQSARFGDKWVDSASSIGRPGK